jgi:hypothetical protein
LSSFTVYLSSQPFCRPSSVKVRTIVHGSLGPGLFLRGATAHSLSAWLAELDPVDTAGWFS